MKKLFVMTVLFVATFAIATAQQRQRPSAEERAKSQTERLEKLVTLTADQKTKIQAINLDLAKKMDDEMKNNQGNREAMRTKMQEIDKTRDAKYKEVLTEEQYKKYTEDKAKREKEMQERRGQRRSQ